VARHDLTSGAGPSAARATVEVVPAGSDADLEAIVAVLTRVVPDVAPDLDELRHMRTFWDELLLLAAREEGEPVASALVGIFPGTEEEPWATAGVSVVPEARRRGIGSDLLRRVSERARAIRKERLLVEAYEDDAESLAWLARRGFVEHERQAAVALDLAAADLPAHAPPAGIRIASRTELGRELDTWILRGMYEVANEANADIPGLDAGVEWTFEKWHEFEIERPSRDPELCFVAFDGDLVVGVASVDVIAGRAFHGLTGVRRSHRGRGIARALKLAQIRAAKARGFARLVTESEETNEPMRRLNESLGYRRIPGMVVLVGPLA
jgi:GNAT superfamily N-acetyltransferase